MQHELLSKCVVNISLFSSAYCSYRNDLLSYSNVSVLQEYHQFTSWIEIVFGVRLNHVTTLLDVKPLIAF